MFREIIKPRFLETDAWGHINNTVLPEWFEQGREPIFKYFTPDLNPRKWALILARIEVDFHAELHYGNDVLIETGFLKIGRSSMEILHRASQLDTLCASGKAVIVHYDFEHKKSLAIPEPIRMQLQEHLVDETITE